MYSMLKKKQLLSQNEMSQNVSPSLGLSQPPMSQNVPPRPGLSHLTSTDYE